MRSREDGFRDGNDSFSSENESADRLAEKSADWHAEKAEAGVLGLTRRCGPAGNAVNTVYPVTIGSPGEPAPQIAVWLC